MKKKLIIIIIIITPKQYLQFYIIRGKLTGITYTYFINQMRVFGH